MIITSLARQRRRVCLFVDGRLTLTLSPEVIAAAGLREGDAVDEGALAALWGEEVRHRAWQAALRLLSYRSRSEAEIRLRLSRRGLPLDVVQGVIDRLVAQGLLDDAAFAGFWVEAHGERGSRRLERELMLKGVPREVTRQAVAGRDDEAAALAAARRRLSVLRRADYQTFQRRLAGYLARRGFSYAIIRRTVEVCWQQRQS